MDSPLRGLEQYEGAPIDQLRAAPRGALINLVDLAIEQSVAFVLIAGDLYDGNWRDYNTGHFFVSQAARLREAGIPLYLISGNHDAANKMTRALRLPENVKMFSTKAPETAMLDEFEVAIHGQGFATAAVTNDLSESYPAAIAGCLNIGMLHTCGTGGGRGNEGHERYAPCTLEGLRSKGYDYWALGHIHLRNTLCEEPFIAFSGNIQGRHVREAGAKGCLMVTVNDDRSFATEFVPLDVMRWEVAAVDVSGVASIDDALERITHELTRLYQNAGDRALAIRVELKGTTNIHRELQSRRHHWTNELRAIAIDAGGGDLWIEKVKLYTTDASRQNSKLSITDGAIGELMALFEQVRLQPEELTGLGFDLKDVSRKLPGDLESLVNLQDPQWIQSVLAESESLLLDRLMNRDAS